ncbi:hypothetical protein [Pantoea agglomerans]|uniref:hypothetical protein n=1 Tax=Enterobacter agglomerans TaxID=549 RepID=UPI0034CE4DDE
MITDNENNDFATLRALGVMDDLPASEVSTEIAPAEQVSNPASNSFSSITTQLVAVAAIWNSKRADNVNLVALNQRFEVNEGNVVFLTGNDCVMIYGSPGADAGQLASLTVQLYQAQLEEWPSFWIESNNTMFLRHMYLMCIKRGMRVLAGGYYNIEEIQKKIILEVLNHLKNECENMPTEYGIDAHARKIAEKKIGLFATNFKEKGGFAM